MQQKFLKMFGARSTTSICLQTMDVCSGNVGLVGINLLLEYVTNRDMTHDHLCTGCQQPAELWETLLNVCGKVTTDIYAACGYLGALVHELS